MTVHNYLVSESLEIAHLGINLPQFYVFWGFKPGGGGGGDGRNTDLPAVPLLTRRDQISRSGKSLAPT